jgi:GNAT superfamily N-acetyltransferase
VGALELGEDVGMTELLDRLERYYDTVPRASATAETIGGFTLFVAKEGFPYYARPALGGAQELTVAAALAVLERQRALGVPEAFEWVDEVTPGAASVIGAAGLEVHRHPLLVLDTLRPLDEPAGVRLRLAGADDASLAPLKAVLDLSFSLGGTAVGEGGPAERDAGARSDDAGVAAWRTKIGQGLMHMVVADDDTGPVGGGSHSPRDGVTELAGIATLPTHRRRGIGAAITARLVQDALGGGCEMCFLSAESSEVARVYENVGFVQVGVACTAEIPG